MYSKSSTNRNFWRLAAFSLLALMAGGCTSGGHRTSGPAPLYGYADIDVLVRLHPGWGGVAQYDEALARLAEAARRAPLTAPDAADLVALPPAAVGDRLAAPQLALEQGSRRLETVERAQISRLRSRQARNRQRQVALKRIQWEQKAAVAFAHAVDAAQSSYARRMSLLAVDQDAQRLNLMLSIHALKKIISGWDASTPPTPELNLARTDLKKNQDELTELETTRRQDMMQARAERDAAIQAAAKSRDASVSTQVAQEVVRLSAQDDKQAAALAQQLGAQRDTLLREVRSLSFAAVPPVGGVGAQRLPNGPVLATTAPGAGHSFRLAAMQLQEQRKRWVDFLYSDTRAAALDAATQQHWIVTYGRPVPGERDLTAPLARELTARVWKT
jgi:hypothetical protein